VRSAAYGSNLAGISSVWEGEESEVGDGVGLDVLKEVCYSVNGFCCFWTQLRVEAVLVAAMFLAEAPYCWFERIHYVA